MLVLTHYLPDLHKRLDLPCQATPLKEGENCEEKLHCTHVRVEEIMKYPECQLFVYVLLLMKLIDDGDFKNVSPFCTLNFLFRPKTLVISFSWDWTTSAQRLLITSQLKQSTSVLLHTKKMVNWHQSDLPYSATINQAVSTMTKLVKQLLWTSSSEATLLKTCTNRLVTSSQRRPSLNRAQTTSMQGICITLARSKPFSLNTQKPKPVWSKVLEKDPKSALQASESLCKNFWLLLNCWWVKFQTDKSSLTQITKNLWALTSRL